MQHTFLHAALALATATIIIPVSSCQSDKHDTADEAPSIEVARSQSDSVTAYRTIPGTLHALNKVDLVARVNGYLRSINYKKGI